MQEFCQNFISRILNEIFKTAKKRGVGCIFHIISFCFKTSKEIWMKLDRKQVLKVLYQVCSFQTDWLRGGSRVGQNRFLGFLSLFVNGSQVSD